jgi:hypothetical protein
VNTAFIAPDRGQGIEIIYIVCTGGEPSSWPLAAMAHFTGKIKKRIGALDCIPFH